MCNGEGYDIVIDPKTFQASIKGHSCLMAGNCGGGVTHKQRAMSMVDKINVTLAMAGPSSVYKTPTILEEARQITDGSRQKEYGDAEDSFERIATYWTAYVGDEHIFTKADVAMMMILLKIAREQNGHKRDHLVDIVGYARLLSKIQGDEKDKGEA